MRSLAILASMLTACGSSSEPKIGNDPPAPPAAAAPAATSGSASTVTAKQLAFPPDEPGPAYFAVEDGVVAILPDGTTQQVAGMTRSDRLTLGLDGAVYATSHEELGEGLAIYKLSGATATRRGSVPFLSSYAFAVDKDGVAYVADYKGLYRFDGKVATKLDVPASPEHISQLAVDGDGNLLAAGYGGASIRAGETWKRLEVPEVGTHDEVWLVGRGRRLVLASSRGFYELAAGKPKRILEETRLNRRPVMTSTGIIGVWAYGPKHPVTQLYDRSGARATSDRSANGSATVIDARGRLWYVRAGSLIVESLLDPQRTAYPLGTLPPLVKVGNDTGEDKLVVVGSGPTTLPPVGAVQVVDAVTGKIVIGGKPLAGAAVEICTFASMSYSGSPCASNPSRVAATTNAAGEFTFAKVPLGMYSLAFKTGNQWGIASDMGVSLFKPGPTKSIGTLDYD